MVKKMVKTVRVYFNKPVPCTHDMEYLWITNVPQHEPEKLGSTLIIHGNGWDSETTSKYRINLKDVAYVEEYEINHGT